MKKKVLSLVLCLAMIVSVFCCIPAVEVGADGSDTMMLNFDGPTAYNSNYYPGLSYMTSNTPMVKGTKYRFSLDWENLQNAAFNTDRNNQPVFMLKLQEDSQYYDCKYYVSGYEETIYELNHGVHVDIEFTYTGVNPSSGTVYNCPDNGELVIALGGIGNGDSANSGFTSYSWPIKFNTANWVLYKYDSNNQLVNTNAIKSMSTVYATNGGSYNNTTNGIHGVSKGSAPSYVGKMNSNTDRDVFWICSDYSWRAKINSIPSSDYFAVNKRMICFDGTNEYSRLIYRPLNKYFNPGTKYKYSFDLDLFNTLSSDADIINYVCVQYFNTNSNLITIPYSSITETKTELTNGYHYEWIFTAPSDSRDYSNMVFKFGDTLISNLSANFKIGNLSLCSLDSNNVPVTYYNMNLPISSTSNISTTSDSSQKVNGINGSWIGITNYMTPITLPEQNDYFKDLSTYDSGEYTNQGTSKTARFVRGASAYLKYDNDNRLFKKNEIYELGFECNLLSGDGLDVSVSLGGTAQTLSGNYDASTKTYTARFTATETTSVSSFKIGTDSGCDTHMLIAKPYVKLVTSGTASGVNYIHDIAANTIETFGNGSVDTAVKQWNLYGANDFPNDRKIYFYDYSNFNPNKLGEERRVTFNDYTWRLIRYHEYDASIKANTTYKIVADYRYFYGDEPYIVFDGINKTNVTTTYDATNRKLNYQFTTTASGSEFNITIGNADNKTVASYGHIYMYECNSSGTPINNTSLIDDLDTMTLDLTYSSTAYGHMWNTRGYTAYDDGIYFGAIRPGFFSANDESEDEVYFPAGENNYQVLAYKDADLFLEAGTYRLSVDVNKIAGDCSVQLRTGTIIGTNVSPSKDITKGNTRTLFFTLGSNAHGAGVMVGNYGDGTTSASAFKNIELRKVEADGTLSDNLIEKMTAITTADTFVDATLNTTTGATSTMWTPINSNSAICILKQDGTQEHFNIIAVSGDVNYDGTLDIIDLVALDDIYNQSASTPRSDINSDGFTNANDVTKLGKIILGVNN